MWKRSVRLPLTARPCRRVAAFALLRGALTVLVLLALCRSTEAQTSVTLPNNSSTMTLTAAVAEQAVIALPASVNIPVNNVGSQNSKSNEVVSVSNIVLATATKQLRVSVQANAASFTMPAGATTTWNASDVSWTTPSGWTNATASNGTLSHLAFNTVATCNAGVTSCSTDKLRFTLAANSSITISGTYTIGIIWKFESIGT